MKLYEMNVSPEFAEFNKAVMAEKERSKAE
jgi:hypothetical protein